MSIPRIGPDKDSDALALLFKRASKNLERIIRTAVKDKRVTEEAYRRRQHTAVLAVLAKLRREYPLPLRRAIRRGWDAGLAIAKIGQPRALHTINFGGGVNEDAMRRIAAEMNGTLSDALGTVGRQADDAFRKAGLLHVATGIASGSSGAQVKKAILEDLVHQGLTAFVDKRGARWRLDTYAALVAHTTTREAVSQGTAQKLLSIDGYPPLVTISSHPHLHDVCSPYDGKTFALPGTTVEGYPTIKRLPPFHPWCRHVVAPSTVSLDLFEAQIAKALAA